MPDEFVKLDRRDDGVAVVRLDRPKMNALSIEVVNQIGEVAKQLRQDPPGSVVIWGGERIFAAGADIEELSEGAQAAQRVTETFHRSLDELAGLGRATIAAITGYALGGGLELALACDFRVISRTAKLGLPEILLGVIPGGGGTQRLARLIGPSRAKDLVMSGRQVQAEEALSIGLADRIADPDRVLEVALQWASQLAAGALSAQELAKRSIDEGIERGLPGGLALERELFVEVFATADAAIGIRSFIENGPGKARFTGK
ncbi:MAG TPA: enoyl-CoA hydratase/isomerase family protein [Acidimicrobiales bacterium]|nr:enoyl-CoA hydratase/isomerase family protein [Acidimicrobiales bacterium]